MLNVFFFESVSIKHIIRDVQILRFDKNDILGHTYFRVNDIPRLQIVMKT